jgi:hypothetical protein
MLVDSASREARTLYTAEGGKLDPRVALSPGQRIIYFTLTRFEADVWMRKATN